MARQIHDEPGLFLAISYFFNLKKKLSKLNKSQKDRDMSKRQKSQAKSPNG